MKSARIRLLLTILQKSEMPVEAAHLIEKTHHNLPEIMRNWEFDDLAEFAAKVLKDLKNRKDEPKEKPKEETEPVTQ